jgi:hypothetical protein
MQLPSPACRLGGRALSGLPFDSTAILAGDHNGQQNAPYLTRGPSNPTYRRTVTAILQGTAFPDQRNATIAIAHKMIWSMMSSSSLPTGALIHSCHSPLLLTKETGPSLWRGLSALAGDAVRSRGATQTGEKKPASVSLLSSSSLITSPHRPSISAGSGPRDPVHSESLYHGSVERIRRARELLS